MPLNNPKRLDGLFFTSPTCAVYARIQAAGNTTGSELASANFVKELSAATKNFDTASDRIAGRIEEAVSSIANGLITETAGVGQKVSAAAVAAGEESRSKVLTAGAEVASVLSGIGQQLTDAGKRMQDTLGATVRELVNVERGIASHVTTISQLSKATLETESAITGTARSLREAGAPLGEASRLMADASKRIAESTGTVERSVIGAQMEIDKVAQLLHRTLESTTQLWERHEQRFKDVDENLGLVLDRIIRSVQENLEALRTFVERVDEKLSGAVDRLGGGIEELGEFAQSIEQATSKFNGANGSHALRPTT